MMSLNRNNYLLAGDIGGTKTSLALYQSTCLTDVPQAEATYQNDDFRGLENIIAGFFDDNAIRPDYAYFGVAGPVINNRVQLTNRDWLLDADELKQKFNLQSVHLINDLVATAMGAVHLPERALQTLNTGHPDKQGAVAVLAPGTGLGEAFLIRNGESLLPCPSEGGHCSFAPVNPRQERLLRFMLNKLNHVSTEEVCSGRGIPDMYDFLKSEITESPELAQSIKQGDRTKIIIDAAVEAIDKNDVDQNPAVETIRLFVEILSSEAANLMLKVMATGGVYIGGGIPPRILPFLKRENFMDSFCKGTYREMLSKVPIHIIVEPKTALIGAAAYGISMLNQPGEKK